MVMKRIPLHLAILLGMVIGAAIGLTAHGLAARGTIEPATATSLAGFGKAIGDVFLRLLSMVIAPLVLTSLVSGIAGAGKLEGLARLSGWTIGYYLTTSMLAIGIGLVLVNAIGPGVGADLLALKEIAGEQPVRPEILVQGGGLGATLYAQLLALIPSNPFAALADPANRSTLAIIFFAILLGIAIVKSGSPHGDRLAEIFESGFEVMMRLTMMVIALAPIGVAGFMLHATAGHGFEVFSALGLYMLTVLIGLLIHALIVLPLLLRLVAARNPLAHAKAMAPALLTAFSTASSGGTLPLTLDCAERRAGLPRRVTSFTLPLGATINMDGTALYEVVAVMFIAQAYGADLTVADQCIVAFTALLASIGAAAVPHAGTVMMVIVLNAVGLPLEGVGLILAVDRVLDMCRTSVNLWSDAVGAAVVTRLSAASAPPPTIPPIPPLRREVEPR
jgi:proton glutamate symport protein